MKPTALPPCPAALVAVCMLFASSMAQAQATQAPAAAESLNPGIEQKYEKIVHEDGGSRISETRIGGTTRSIQVESKLGGQAYEVVPADGSRRIEPGWNNAKDTVGKAQWRVGNF